MNPNDGQKKFETCKYKEWRKFESIIGCCPDDRKLEIIEGWYCPERRIAQLSSEICLDCWMFEKKD